MKNLKRVFRDFCRGYTDDDMRSLLVKMNNYGKPGPIIKLTPSEYRALKDKDTNK